MKKVFHLKLHELRTNCGLSQKEVADKMKVALGDENFGQSKYQRYESGEHEPNLSQLMAFCQVFHVSSDWILGLSDNADQKQEGLKPSFNARLDDVKRNAEQATASINALQSAIAKLGKII